ncbi:unnamed protein product [Schistocephalus solidus]|uniref:Uncharacterized protein n=1 Tax=Schistocephalus solidus TaxID=70667 RepID=A0A183TNZ3_SCHSO|nr:unnamed protein product [Schistocephalus solidus]
MGAENSQGSVYMASEYSVVLSEDANTDVPSSVADCDYTLPPPPDDSPSVRVLVSDVHSPREIWLTLETAYICLLRSSETANDVMGCGPLSVDLQNLHSSGLMLVQCLVGLTAPFDIISAPCLVIYAESVGDDSPAPDPTSGLLVYVLTPGTVGELSVCRTQIALSNFAAGLHFDPIMALNLIFAQNARLSRLLLAPPSWMAFCVPENCANFPDVASIHKAFYRIFATCPEHEDYYSALLLPLLQSLPSLECLDIHSQFPTLPNFPAWLSALLDFLGDSLDE